jgi:hypothetical protein
MENLQGNKFPKDKIDAVKAKAVLGDVVSIFLS